MRKVIKPLVLVIAAILLILVIAISALPFLIEPNSYKPEIVALIKEKTGRSAQIEGDIRLSVFPWIGFGTEKIVLNNKPGFQDRPFITLAHSEIKVKLLPLLSKKIQVNKIALDGLIIDLVKDKQGLNNWDDLVTPSQTSAAAKPANQTTPESKQQTVLAALTVGGIVIKDAQILFDNQQTGEQLAINKLNFNVEKFAFNVPVKIDLAADVSGKKLNFPGAVKIATALCVDEKLENLEFIDNQVEWLAAQKKSLSSQPLEAKLTAPSGVLSISQQSLKLPQLQIQSGDVQVRTDLSVEHIFDVPSLQGTATLKPFNPRPAFKQWEIALPSMSDSKALTSLGLIFQFQANPEQIELKGLDFALDDSHGKGTVLVKNFAKPAVVFDIEVDKLNVDHYLPRQDKPSLTSPGMAVVASTFSLPLDWLKNLDAEGKLALGAMTFNKLILEDVHLTLSSKNGIVKVEQSAKHKPDGTYSSELNVDVQHEKPTYKLQENLANIPLEPLLRATKGDAKLGGILTLSSQLQGQGGNPRELRTHLTGQVDFFLKDGFIKGFDLEKMLASGKNLLKGGAIDIDAKTDQTAFSVIKGTASFNKGLLQNDDLIAKTAKLRSTGKGNINLYTEALDYTLTSKMLKGSANANAPEQLHDTPVVIHLGGTFNKPTFSLDVEALLTEKNKAKIERFVDKNKDKIDKLINKLDKKSGSKVKDLLKKIF